MDRSKRRAIALIVLVALVAIPAVAGVCAAICAPIARAAHGGSASSCHGARTDDVRVAPAASRHECGDHQAVLRDATAAPAAARIDRHATAFPAAARVEAHRPRASVTHTTAYRSPPAGRVARTPAVLRV